MQVITTDVVHVPSVRQNPLASTEWDQVSRSCRGAPVQVAMREVLASNKDSQTQELDGILAACHLPPAVQTIDVLNLS